MAAKTSKQSENTIFDSEHLANWINTVNADPEFQLTSRWTDVVFEIKSGDKTGSFRIAAGKLESSSESAGERSIVLEGTEAAWWDFLTPVPLPKNHHILAMDRHRSDFSIAAGRHWFIQNLRVMDVALQLLRESAPIQGKNHD